MTKKAQQEFGALGQQVRKMKVLDPYKLQRDRRGKRPVKMDTEMEVALQSLRTDFGIHDAITPALAVAIETANEVASVLDEGGTWEQAREAGIRTNEFWRDQTRKVCAGNLDAFLKLTPERKAGAIHLMTVATGGDSVDSALVTFIGFDSLAAREAVMDLKKKLKNTAA